jgi:hypothetical protein
MDWILLASMIAAAVAAVSSLLAVRDARAFHKEERASAAVDRLLAVHGIVAEIQERAAKAIHEGSRGEHIPIAIARRRLTAALVASPDDLPECKALADLDSSALDETFLIASEDALRELQTAMTKRRALGSGSREPQAP